MSAAPHHPNRTLRCYDFIMVAFVTVLLCSNLIGMSKAARVTLPVLGSVTFGAGVLFFPISCIFGDILTEVYGCGRDQRVVWAGLAALIFTSFTSLVVLALPVVPFMAGYQRSLNDVFGSTPRIVAGPLTAFWCGSFANSYTLAEMKTATEGKWLWTRIVGSAVVGETVDSSLFYVIAFYGIWPHKQVLRVAIVQYILKTGWEIVTTPLTYRVVAFFKRIENEDYCDHDTNSTPFQLKV